MSDVILRRYHFSSIQGEGWATFVIGSDGYFSAVSDYGNYSYYWPHHGCTDFRQFLVRAPRDWDYFAKKLNPMRGYAVNKTVAHCVGREVENFVRKSMGRLADTLEAELKQEGVIQ